MKYLYILFLQLSLITTQAIGATDSVDVGLSGNNIQLSEVACYLVEVTKTRPEIVGIPDSVIESKMEKDVSLYWHGLSSSNAWSWVAVFIDESCVYDGSEIHTGKKTWRENAKPILLSNEISELSVIVHSDNDQKCKLGNFVEWLYVTKKISFVFYDTEILCRDKWNKMVTTPKGSRTLGKNIELVMRQCGCKCSVWGGCVVVEKNGD